MEDWKQQLAKRFSKLERTAVDAEIERQMPFIEVRGIKSASGQEYIQHSIVEPQPCLSCGLLTKSAHAKVDCIRELRAALEFATANIRVVRHG